MSTNKINIKKHLKHFNLKKINDLHYLENPLELSFKFEFKTIYEMKETSSSLFEYISMIDTERFNDFIDFIKISGHKHYIGDYNFNTGNLELFIIYKGTKFNISNTIEIDFKNLLETILNNHFIEVFKYYNLY